MWINASMDGSSCCICHGATVYDLCNVSALAAADPQTALQASQSIDDCLTVLQQLRDDDTFSDIFARATAINEEEISMPRLTARQQNRSNVTATCPLEYYKRAVFLPFIDTCIAQLNERFRRHAAKAYQLSALLPSVCKTRTFADIQPAAELYRHFLPDGNINALRTQYLRWKAYWNRQPAKVNS